MNRLASRSGQYAEDQLPEPGALEYLLNYLSEVGEAKVNGEHLCVIGWEDFSTWSAMTGIQLSPGETLALRRLSAAYVDQQWRSKDASCPSPTLDEERSRASVEKKIGSLFALLRKPKNE